MKKHIPNLLTSLNAFSGCVGMVAALEGHLDWAVFWVVVAGIFDFFDGFSARLLHSYSAIGKELDSLADLISFGMLPSFCVYTFLRWTLYYTDPEASGLITYIPYTAFLLVIFSALRLAKFNLDERQTTSFIGLATPSNALFWTSLCAGLAAKNTVGSGTVVLIVALIVIFSLLMVSEIPMFAIKKLSFKWKGNEQLIIVTVFGIVSTILFHFLGLALAVAFYVAVCCFSALMHKTRTTQ